MNYQNDVLIDKLAAEYVIGTLQGRARKRFERLMVESFKIRRAVWEWERQINGLVAAVEDVAPPRQLWNRINNQLGSVEPSTKTGFFASINLWRGWSLAVSAALLVLLLMTGIPKLPTSPAEFVAVFNDSTSQPLWLVSTNMTTGDISIRAINAQAQAVDKAFELWMLPTSGNPRSLGLLPVSGSENEFVLTPQLLQILKNATGLAVSVEPRGGSPTGLPTGPVVYQAQLIPL